MAKAVITKPVGFKGTSDYLPRGTIVLGRLIRRGEEKGLFNVTGKTGRGWHVYPTHFKLVEDGKRRP